MKTRDICVMGLGYIGLPTASLFATRGNRVVGVDVNPRVVETIRRGGVHIEEPDLDVLVKSAVNSGNLVAQTEPVPADVFIIAVPTPHTEHHEADLTYVEAATRAVAPYVRAKNLVILESTSPVGTTEKIAQWLGEANPALLEDGRLTCLVAHCPERVLPGRILYELVENHRVVGGLDPIATAEAVEFYRTVVKGEVHATDARTAEMCKLVENSFRDVNIAFANELSMISHELGINVRELIRLANLHPRVNILQPGPGVGGHCIAVDPWFVVAAAPERAKLIRTARHVNLAKEDWVVEQVMERARRFRDPVVGCLGLTYKPDVDDLRESPALTITRRLRETFPALLAADPHVPRFDEFKLTPTDEVVRRSDILLVLVAHKEFRAIDRELLKSRIVLDTCGAFP